MNASVLTAPILRARREYPFEDLPDYVHPIVVRAVLDAWARIVEDSIQQGGSLGQESENALTTRLAQALNDIQCEPDHPSGFSGSLFQNVVRDAAVTSFDDRSLAKRPDLAIRLINPEPGSRRSQDYGLFVECKVIGPDHPIKDYCGKGILRFVSGEYAWAMPSGMMIGYNHADFSIAALTTYLLTSESVADLQTRFAPRPVPGILESQVHESSHGRIWAYPTTGKSPGDIRILHLWLPLP